MRSNLKSCFTIIILLAIISSLYMFANPSVYYEVSDRLGVYIQSAKKNKGFSWLGKVFDGNKYKESNTPILMYHHVKDHKESDDEVEKGLSVPTEIFKKQMKYLSDNGYRTTSLDEIFSNDYEKNIVLTFDDGYDDVYKYAYPEMKKYGFTGTVFVITDYIGKDRYLDLEELNKLKKAGWQIESHTISHPNLANTSRENVSYEISQSKKIIEESLGSVVTFLSYPAGKYDDEVIDLAKKAGYKGAVSTQQGVQNNIDEIYELKRERVGGYSELDDFIGLLN